ncbi:MAG: MFS transporter [Oscillospiraceae bacterium]|nr:MFS transporter [Oscillospiraceae bacterium]
MAENKLDIKKTLLLSFGFFASSIAWSIYNSFVPQILDGFIKSTALIGFIMTFDNIFGLIFQPLFGKWSDKTHTRFGRRMPFIIIGIPICAVAFALIPKMGSIWSLMAVIIIFTFVMSVWRSPVVALMPDITPGPLRSQANGIVNLMGGVGSLVAFAGGGMLFKLGGFPLPFLMSAVCMIIALAVLVLFVREPKHAYEPEKEAKKIAIKLSPKERKSLLLILFGVFFWFTGYNAVETFFTLYAKNTLNMDSGSAAITLAIFSLTFLIFAVPTGFIGARIGRRKTIIIGLIGITLLFVPLIFFSNVWLTRICLFVGGAFWACVNINSLPMVVKLSGEEKVGTFVGYYYFFSFGSQIISPILFGYIRDLVGQYRVLFLYSSIAFALALACLIFVRHGEDEPSSTSTAEVLDGLGD